MFDIGFMEMTLIGVVALVVIGPERLPGVARTVGQWMGSARRFMSSVQADINMEVNKSDTLKRLLEEQASIQSLHEIIEQTPTESHASHARKPVPRAVPSSSSASHGISESISDNEALQQPPEQQSESQSEPLSEPHAEKKPEYRVKAIGDTPATDENASPSSAQNRSQNSKHD